MVRFRRAASAATLIGKARLPPDPAIRSGSVINARRTKTPIIRLGRCAARELHDIIESDKFPFSPRIRSLRAILGKLRPEPMREPLPPPKVMHRRGLFAAGAAAGEIRTRPTDDARRRGRGRRPPHRMVPGCQHRVEPDPTELARQYGGEINVLEWRDRLVCSRCGGREVDMSDDILIGHRGRVR